MPQDSSVLTTTPHFVREVGHELLLQVRRWEEECGRPHMTEAQAKAAAKGKLAAKTQPKSTPKASGGSGGAGFLI